jgi:tRNA-specific 2-thiouridylase
MKKVVVAMSGGVDSAVAAAILKSRGYDVIGVFMKFWQESGKGKENKCCSLQAKLDAKRVAVKLGIPFYVIDAQKEFKKKVVDYFIKEYKKGRTPNPCVECNRWIKFKILLDKLSELKADYIATGHYARIQRKFETRISNFESNSNFKNSKIESKFKIKNLKLITARDGAKDQSYFLWTLNQKQLSKILFPIGDYTKEQARGLAKKFKLPVFNKKDSQEICFTTNVYEFLNSRIHANRGPIITNEGEKVGEHKGLAFYTIGQRRGIEVGGTGPYYVIRKDFKKNALIVGQGDFNEALFKKEFTVSKANWLDKPEKFPFRCKVKIRYGHKAVPCIVSKFKNSKLNQNSKFKIIFGAPQRAITPGQSAMFYKKNEVLGGGIIEK